MRLVRVDAPVEHRRTPARGPRALSAAIATLALAALATGCQAGQGSGAAAGGTTAITVAAIPGADNAPLYLAAAKRGLFSQDGLDVTIKSYQSVGQELKALNAGQVDVAAGDYADFFYTEATSRRAGLRIVADGYHAAPGVMEVLTSPDSGITTPHDLLGKIIGTPDPQVMPVKKGSSVPYSLETVATQSVLENNGVDPAKVTWKQLPSGDLINALADHRVNAILVQEPYIYEAQSRLGAIEVLDSCSGATASLPLTGYFAIQSFADKNQEALLDFRSALQQAQGQAVLPGPVHAVLASDSGMSMQSASLVTIGAYPTSLDAAGLQRVADLMFSFGALTTAFEVAPMVFH